MREMFAHVRMGGGVVIESLLFEEHKAHHLYDAVGLV